MFRATVCYILFCTGLAWGNLVYAQKQEDLGQLIRKQEVRTLQQINQLDSSINELKSDINALNLQITQHNKNLSEIRAKNHALNFELIAQRNQTISLLQKIHSNGPNNQLQTLLKPGGSAVKEQLTSYYHYMQRARNKKITNYQEKIIRQTELNQQQSQALASLQRLQKQKSTKTENLETARSFATRQLIRIRKERSNLYSHINQRASYLNAIALPFVAARGFMPMPIKGTIQNRFGAKNNSGLKWHGWHIKSQQQQQVKAIFGGTIKHIIHHSLMGLLIVIDHGENYLSLYAQNHNTQKQEKDTIEAGDVIATINANQEIYFSLLHNGMPLDPEPWIDLLSP